MKKYFSKYLNLSSDRSGGDGSHTMMIIKSVNHLFGVTANCNGLK